MQCVRTPPPDRPESARLSPGRCGRLLLTPGPSKPAGRRGVDDYYSRHWVQWVGELALTSICPCSAASCSGVPPRSSVATVAPWVSSQRSRETCPNREDEEHVLVMELKC